MEGELAARTPLLERLRRPGERLRRGFEGLSEFAMDLKFSPSTTPCSVIQSIAHMRITRVRQRQYTYQIATHMDRPSHAADLNKIPNSKISRSRSRSATLIPIADHNSTMNKLKVTSAELVKNARARIEELETVELISQLDDPKVQIIDIRDIRERQRSGFIPGSFHAPRGMIEFWVDPDSPYFKDIFGEDRKFVFHCASGWRSALTVATLQDMGFEASHLKEGFSTWEEHGGPIEQERRQK